LKTFGAAVVPEAVLLGEARTADHQNESDPGGAATL
jgi:hypothetical protein